MDPVLGCWVVDLAFHDLFSSRAFSGLLNDWSGLDEFVGGVCVCACVCVCGEVHSMPF